MKVLNYQITEGAGASTTGLIGGTSLGFASARALPGVTGAQLEDAIVDEFERFIADGPTTAEVARVKAQYEREWLGELARFDNRADLFSSYATLQGDPEAVNRRLDEIRAVTIDDVAAAASDWLAADQRAVVTYHRERA